MTADTQFRADITRQMESSAKAHQETAVILERLKGQIDDHDRRLEALERSPEGARNMFGTYGGCIGQAVVGVFAGLSVLISTAALIITLTR